MKNKERKKGFTLVELLIVIAITGTLMAIAAPKYSGMVDKANKVQAQSYAREIINYIDIYNAENTNEKNIKEESTIDSLIKEEGVFKNNEEFKAVVSNPNLKEDFSSKKVSDIRELANDKQVTQ